LLALLLVTVALFAVGQAYEEDFCDRRNYLDCMTDCETIVKDEKKCKEECDST
ncbi:hypothetical protein Ciccas_014568, partial [Cichlidogyrus casuarinus]